MQVDITPKPDVSQAELKIRIPASDFKPYLARAAKKISEEKPLKGFRPGKAPLNTVVEVYGEEHVVGHAIDRAVPNFFVQAVLDQDIEAINRPSIAINESSISGDLVFTATVDIMPEVKLGDISKIKVEKRESKVTDEELSKELTVLAKYRAQYLDVARPTEEGDKVEVDFKISIDGKIIEGGEAEKHPIVIGEGRFLPDFEEGLKGVSSDGEKTFPMKFPEDYGHKDFAGKEASAWVKVHSVQKQVLPEINDEFAKGLGKFDSLEDLKAKLKENMQHDKEHKEAERYQGQLVDELTKASTFSIIPEVLVNKEIERRIHELAQMLQVQQKSLEQYMQETGKDAQAIQDEIKPAAEQSVRSGLVLATLAKQEKITVSEEEITEKVNEYMQRFANDPKTAEQIDVDELKQSIESTLKNQKTIQKLEELVNS